MLLFGLAKFFARFFLQGLIFQCTAAASVAWILPFSHEESDAPEGVANGCNEDKDNGNLLNHGL